MARGRPRKRARNTAGLRNQSNQSTEPHLPDADTSPNDNNPISDDLETGIGTYHDSTRLIVNDDDGNLQSDTDVEELSDEDWGDDELQESMYMMAINEGDDPTDEDWTPTTLRRGGKVKTGPL